MGMWSLRITELSSTEPMPGGYRKRDREEPALRVLVVQAGRLAVIYQQIIQCEVVSSRFNFQIKQVWVSEKVQWVEEC